MLLSRGPRVEHTRDCGHSGQEPGLPALIAHMALIKINKTWLRKHGKEEGLVKVVFPLPTPKCLIHTCKKNEKKTKKTLGNVGKHVVDIWVV